MSKFPRMIKKFVALMTIFLMMLGGCKDPRSDIPVSAHAGINKAALDGDLAEAKRLIDKYPAILRLGWFKFEGHELIPLQSAVTKNDKEMVELLLARGADVNQATSNGTTALHIAASYGFDDLVSVLLDHGADPNRKDGSGGTPLMATISFGMNNSFDLLVEKSDLRIKGKNGMNVLGEAVAFKNDFAVSRLVGKKELINRQDDFGYTPLIIAATLGNIASVKELLHAGADKGIKDKAGKTAYEEAFPQDPAPIRKILDSYP